MIRAVITVTFQLTIMEGFTYARKAKVSGAIVTSLLSLYVIFVSALSRVIFNEKLKP